MIDRAAVPYAAIRVAGVADVLPFLALFPAVLGVLWATVVVHEGGHYLVGRCVGVPASDMKISLGRPSFVALRQGQQWVSPDDEKYIPAFVRHNPSRSAAWLFVAGGFLVETGVVLLLVLAFQDHRTLALLVLGASSFVFVTYLLLDVITALRAGVAAGDGSAMWRLSIPATLVALAITGGLRAASFIHLL